MAVTINIPTNKNTVRSDDFSRNMQTNPRFEFIL